MHNRFNLAYFIRISSPRAFGRAIENVKNPLKAAKSDDTKISSLAP